MFTYTNNKTLLAKPMNLVEYEQYIGNHITDEDVEPLEGYLLEHPERQSNHADHVGAIEWLPKYEFEYSHKCMGDVADYSEHSQRIIAEHLWLTDKLSKLVAFTKTPQFLKLAFNARDLLQEQCRIMTRYVAILEERLLS